MTLTDFTDFSGGLNKDLPPENALDTMLAECLNLYWNAGVKKRRGYGDVYSHASGAINGHIELMIENLGVTILAVNISDVTHFYSNYSGSMAEIDSGYTWAEADVSVQMADMDQKVIIVDESGVSGPGIIYYDSGMVIENLDDFDVRTIDEAFWFAGQYDSSESDADAYIDYTCEEERVQEDIIHKRM